MARIFNFSAGPSALPQEVLEQAQAELLDYQSTGMSVMEMSHRSDVFVGIASRAEADFRDLLGVSDNYHVLFLQGGATTQFASIPLNLTQVGDTVDYLDTGAWSSKAVKEAAKYCHVNVVASGKSGNYSSIPDVAQWRHGNNARYLHICSNETIGGVQFKQFPNVSVPLVADMSSDFLSRPVDVDRFAVIYGGAQKNIGPAGLTLVVVRKDLCGSARVETPGTLDFAVQAGAVQCPILRLLLLGIWRARFLSGLKISAVCRELTRSMSEKPRNFMTPSMRAIFISRRWKRRCARR